MRRRAVVGFHPMVNRRTTLYCCRMSNTTNSSPKKARRTNLLVAGFMALALLAVAGCKSTHHESGRGGIVPLDEGFSITVPRTSTVRQGDEIAVPIVLNRGADFRRDVRLDMRTDGIEVKPDSVLVKASDKPEVQCHIRVPREAALGDHRVFVTGTPTTGKPASTVFVVTVIAQ
jgi:hypothetical protein